MILRHDVDFTLEKALLQPTHPVIAIVGGSKVSTKLDILNSLLNKVDILIVGGGIANTFMAASGLPIGKSLYEASFIAEAQKLLQQAKQNTKQTKDRTTNIVSLKLAMPNNPADST